MKFYTHGQAFDQIKKKFYNPKMIQGKSIKATAAWKDFPHYK